MTIKHFVSLLAGLLAAGVAHGAECPNAKTAKDGFILERPGVRSLFRLSAEMVVQVANTFDSSPPQTQFFLGGLIEVFRTSATGRVAMLPFSDLRSIFPLRSDARHKITLMRLQPGETVEKPMTLEIEVTGKETLSLGDCKYDVLAVEQTIRSGDGEELEAWTALYASDLQAVLAKRYDEGTAQESIVGYEAIKPLAE